MALKIKSYHFLVPLIGAVTWCGGLLAMIITWAAQGKPHYISEDGTIPFISDIAADILKPLFVPICSITAISFVLSLTLERWLRHVGRLPRNMRTREKVFAWFAIFGAVLGGLSLILLSVFDTKRFNKVHRIFLLIFVIGVALSAIFTVLEYRWINKHHAFLPQLKCSYGLKAIIVIVLIPLAVAFGATLGNKKNVAAVLEWTVGFGFTIYLLTFVYDLRMARSWVDEDGSYEMAAPPANRY